MAISGAQWLSGRVLDSRPRGRGFEPHRRHCVVVLEQDTFIYPSLVLVQPRKTRPCLTEKVLMGRKESNQTKKVPTSVGLFKRLRKRYSMDYALFYMQKGEPQIPHKEIQLHKVPLILLNKPLTTILWSVGCTHSLCLAFYTSV